MSQTNGKVELKLKQANYCVLTAAGVDNASKRDDKIIFTIKDSNLYVPFVTLLARDNLKLLSKGFERIAFRNEYKAKIGIKSTTNKYRFFQESKFVELNRFVLI